MINQYTHLYFIGIGGIGMSALARYFKAQGKQVSGYDRTPSPLTSNLQDEGISISFTDAVSELSEAYQNPQTCLVVYTPAIPDDSVLFNWFRNHQFTMKKRAQVLGLLSRSQQSICVSGTHGKTTISTMISHLLYQSKVGCNAFLGGISQNYKSNLLLCKSSNKVVIEADEFDRSFLNLYPHTATVSATDADHLDIYGDHHAMKKTFQEFSSQVEDDGILIYKTGLDFTPKVKDSVKVFTYNIDAGDFHTRNLELLNGHYHFDFVTPEGLITDFTLGIPGLVNVENAVVALASAYCHGVEAEELRQGLQSFKGIKRRFEYHVNTPDLVYIDDYAHHPEELKATISSVKAIYPHKKVTGIFQPHLYSRTQDFASEFAQALSLLDELWLMDIYPAREQPIVGVDSQLIFKDVTCSKMLVTCEQIENMVLYGELEVLLTLGAGDIDRMVPNITRQLNENIS